MFALPGLEYQIDLETRGAPQKPRLEQCFITEKCTEYGESLHTATVLGSRRAAKKKTCNPKPRSKETPNCLPETGHT